MEGDIPQKMLDEIERDRERGKLCPNGSGNRGTPYRDENGEPQDRLVTFSVMIESSEPPAPLVIEKPTE